MHDGMQDTAREAPASPQLLSASGDMRSEYCAKLVRIGALLPIEGSEAWMQTVVEGFCCKVERGRFEEGEVAVYCLNETALNADFLRVNNLYEIDEYERNANAEAVAALLAVGHRIEARKLTGCFGRYGRVRMERVEGVLTFGYLFKVDELVRWKPALREASWERYLHVDADGYEHSYNFDTVCGDLFVKAFEPRPHAQWRGLSKGKRKARRVKFDRLVEGQFAFHYDTMLLRDNIWRFRPTTEVSITVKMHGTSAIVGNLLTRRPTTASAMQQWMGRRIDEELRRLRREKRRYPWQKEQQRRAAERLEALRPEPSVVEYGPVYSSRTVVKNRYLKDTLGPGFYEVDIWSEYGRLLYPHLGKGMTVYGEICGYVTGRDMMVMEGYDYGCAVGENFMVPYRITETDAKGRRREWSVAEVMAWTEAMRRRSEELGRRLRVLTLLYSGTMEALYPDVPTAGRWHEMVLQRLASDHERMGMEEPEPLCHNEVPREGVVVRIVNDAESEAFKLKSDAFVERETLLMDQAEAAAKQG